MYSTVPARYNPGAPWASQQRAETAMILGGASAGGLLGLALWRGLGDRLGSIGVLVPIAMATGGALLWMTLISGE